MQYNIYNGKRQSMVTVYLRPAMSRPNLHVATLAHVHKVGFVLTDRQTDRQTDRHTDTHMHTSTLAGVQKCVYTLTMHRCVHT